MITLIELYVVAGLVLIAFVYPSVGSQSFDRLERRFSQLARRRRLSLLVVAFVSIGLRLAVLPIMPIPAPAVDDEFSYLLQADTFLHGRLTNQTHPMWTHFESFHTNMLPTYQSKFPPAQGLVLAAGKLIGGAPIWGVWLSMAAMCVAICWMLQEWMSPEWALAGGLLVAIRLSAFSYWGNSYWGGAVSATGGALVLGSLARMHSTTRLRDALVMALGIAILAASRPYEGSVLCIPVAIALFSWWLKKKGLAFRLAIRRTVIPLALCVALTGAMIGYYNWRLTGHPLLLPYELNEKTYFVSPLFIFQKPRPQPDYRNNALRDFYLCFDLPQYEETQSTRGLLASWYGRSENIWLVLLGPLFTLPLALALLTDPRKLRQAWPPQSPREVGVAVARKVAMGVATGIAVGVGEGAKADWRTRFLFWASLISIAGLAVEVYGLPHYAGPMTGLLFLVVVLAMRRIRRLQFRGRRFGLFLCRAIPMACLLMFALRAAAAPLHIDVGDPWPPAWYNSDTQVIPRTAYEQMLKALPGRHLVIVYYKSDDDPDTFHEWVYNAADIDSSKIVWAWDMGAEKNHELLNYFKDRQVWKVNMDGTPVQEPSANATPTQ